MIFLLEELKYKYLKHIAIGAFLTIGGCVALCVRENTVAGTCFGALAGYVIKNGVVK